MIRQLLLSTLLTLGFYCNSNSKSNTTELSFPVSDKTPGNIKENIRFDFTAGRINTFQETIEIKASLFNDNIDTVYFLSSICDGEQYSLRYDTAKFVLTPMINCNASNLIVIKIAPKSRHTFQAHFRCGSKETTIKLGFDFYAVDKTFDLKGKHLDDIYNRPKDQQTIIWTDETIIK